MALKIFLVKPPKHGDVITVYSNLFTTAREILDALDIEVEEILTAKLRLVRKADIRKKVLHTEVVAVRVDRGFKFTEHPDLSEFSIKYSEGYIDAIVRYRGAEFIGKVWAEAGMPDDIRNVDGDIRINIRNEELGVHNIADVIREEEIFERLKRTRKVLSWEIEY